MRKRLVAWKVTCFRKIDIYGLHQLDRTAFSIVSFDMHFYLFKIFLRFWLASFFYFHNLLVLTKFGKCFRLYNHCHRSLRHQGMMYRVARNFCGSLFLRIRNDWFFLLGINFLRFSESIQYPTLIVFSFLLSTCNRNTYFQTRQRYAYPM